MATGDGRTDGPVLVTGFEPFAGLPTNPSAMLAACLDGETAGDVRIVARVLPVSRARAPGLLAVAMEELRPRAVLLLGLAAGAAAIRVETVALNAVDFAVPDNDGDRTVGGVRFADGPEARRASVDGPALVAAIEAAGVPARLSFHAGGHLCNLALYTALSVAERMDPPPCCGFLHLPHLAEEVIAERAAGRLKGAQELASLSFDAELRAVLAAIVAIIR